MIRENLCDCLVISTSLRRGQKHLSNDATYWDNYF
jgi:hypothetical protein